MTRGTSAAGRSTGTVTDGSRRRNAARSARPSASRWPPAPSPGPPTRRRTGRAFGFPVAAKLASRRVMHKSDIGAVRLNLKTAEEVRMPFTRSWRAHRSQRRATTRERDGVLIQPMVTDAVETIVGVDGRSAFRPARRVRARWHASGNPRRHAIPHRPADRPRRRRAAARRPGRRALQGYRGRPAADLDALRDVVLRVSRLAEAVPEISRARSQSGDGVRAGKGCRIVDARIRVAMPPHHT